MKLELSHVELLLELFPLFVELRVFSARPGKFLLDVSPLLRNELGALQHLTGDHQTAATSLTQALTLFREVGDRVEEAEALNHLGALQATTLGPQEALARYSEALTITRDTGSPLEQADALTGIGRCHIHTGNTAGGTALLRQALDIYQRIGSPSAQRIQKILDEHPADAEHSATPTHPRYEPPMEHRSSTR